MLHDTHTTSIYQLSHDCEHSPNAKGTATSPAQSWARRLPGTAQQLSDGGMLKWQEQGYESPSLAPRPQPSPSQEQLESEEQAEEARAQRKLEQGIAKLELVLKDALLARSTPHLSENRVLRNAFRNFDRDLSGKVDEDEFCRSLEHLGMHIDKEGLPGLGGLQPEIVRGLFRRFDDDASGQLDYEEFIAGLIKPSDHFFKKT
jgi:hypothetical protein